MHGIVKRLLFLMGFIGVLFIFGSSNIAQADTANQDDDLKDENADYIHALETAPKGLNWDNQAFKKADFSEAAKNRVKWGTLKYDLHNPATSKKYTENSVKIIEPTEENKLKNSVIRMTDGKHQTGSVWSNPDKSNYFEINHHQKASMWLYFGETSKDSVPGDGMAFVLQNDPNGTNSIALADSVLRMPTNSWNTPKNYIYGSLPVDGQSMGVWGADWNNYLGSYLSSKHKLTTTAIQNSWALEFDTFVDYSTFPNSDEGVFFDGQIPIWTEHESSPMSDKKHIAGGYPSSPNTYEFWSSNYFDMIHDNLEYYPDLVDSKWHHVTIEWIPGENNIGTLTYTYNDKDPNTRMPITKSSTVGPNNATSKSFSIDTSKFNLKNGDNKLYWGFTASTGNNSENNLLIFESIPSYVDAEASSSIYDETQGGQEINDKNDTVDPNTDIRYEYTLDYKGWTKDWNNIVANMEIPKNIHFTKGTITYPMSPTNNNPRSIPQSVFDSTNDNSNTKLSYTLPEKLSPESPKATIKLYGTTTEKAQETLTVPQALASFEGDNLITDTTARSFNIRPRALSLKSSSTNPITVGPNKDLTVPGQVTYLGNDNKKPDFNNMVVHQVLTPKDSKNSPRILSNVHIDDKGNFNLNIKANQLDKINSLKFYVTYDDNENSISSNSIQRTINVGGLLAFGNVQNTVSFQSTDGSFTDKTIPRLNKWQIEVNDSREKGSTWEVQASSTDLKLVDNTKLKGNLFYRNPKDKVSDINITNNLTTVATHIKSVDGNDRQNIIDSWTENSGVLLFMKHGNPSGTYKGKITWSLLDSIR